MLIYNTRTLNRLAAALAPRVAERLATMPRPGDREGSPEDLLTEAASAAILGLMPATLGSWRARGHGPAYIRLGTKRRAPIRYKRGVILEYRDRGAVTPGGR